jgi:hypothetical protein
MGGGVSGGGGGGFGGGGGGFGGGSFGGGMGGGMGGRRSSMDYDEPGEFDFMFGIGVGGYLGDQLVRFLAASRAAAVQRANKRKKARQDLYVVQQVSADDNVFRRDFKPLVCTCTLLSLGSIHTRGRTCMSCNM